MRRSMPVSGLALLVVALLASACGAGSGGASSGPGGEGTADALAPLDGDWVLIDGTTPAGRIEPGDGFEITLTIAPDGWSGSVCNHYRTDAIDIGDGTVTVSDITRTEMGCPADGVMEAETRYLDALLAVRSYEVAGDELTLTGDAVVLTFAGVEATPPAPLVGTVWVLDTVFEGGGPGEPDGTARSVAGPDAELELADDGTFAASSPCVANEGEHEVADGRLRLRFAFDADYDCGSEELWAEDSVVWRVLGSDPVVELDGQRLTLWGEGEGLGYAAR